MKNLRNHCFQFWKLSFMPPIAFRAIHAASFLTTEKTRCQTEFSSKRKNYESRHLFSKFWAFPQRDSHCQRRDVRRSEQLLGDFRCQNWQNSQNAWLSCLGTSRCQWMPWGHSVGVSNHWQSLSVVLQHKNPWNAANNGRSNSDLHHPIYNPRNCVNKCSYPENL